MPSADATPRSTEIQDGAHKGAAACYDRCHRAVVVVVALDQLERDGLAPAASSSLPGRANGRIGCEESVNVRYTRLFTSSDGSARFQDLEMELQPGFAVPPADPLHTAQFLPAEWTFWMGAPTTWMG
jgi:hypothetical protein